MSADYFLLSHVMSCHVTSLLDLMNRNDLWLAARTCKIVPYYSNFFRPYIFQKQCSMASGGAILVLIE